MSENVSIERAVGAPDMAHIRTLFVEYQKWMGVDLCFQGFEEEINSLPGPYAPPRGCLLLARDGEAIAGGVGMWPLSKGDHAGSDTCEMKRLFVRPPWRGTGLGRRLATTIIDQSISIGYQDMVLDTLEELTAAIALYRSMGFKDIPAYYDNPLESVLYMGLDLADHSDHAMGDTD